MENLNIVIGNKKEIDGVKFHEVEGGFGEGKKAMLVSDIAKIHGRELRVVNQTINRNRKRFKDGVDILNLLNINLSDIKNKVEYVKENYGLDISFNTKSIYILSERGYSKLLKIMEDDLAWELYDKLVDGYFNMRRELKEHRMDSYMIQDPVKRAKRWIEEEEKRQLLAAQNKKLEKEVEYKEDIIVGLVDDIDLATKRQRLNQIVRKCNTDKISDRWRLLYSEFEAKYHINLNTRLKRYKRDFKPQLKNKLDYIDRGMDKIPELYELACKVFENEVEKLKKEWFDNIYK